MRQIPNLFTLLNLVFGCIAIVFILQPGETIVYLDESGSSQVQLPERIGWGAILIFAAAVIDFLDGFLARLLKAPSDMGKQLDSLSDIVSFGVAPGMIFYQLLRMSYAQEEGGLDISLTSLLPAFIFTSAVAWRLAKFNISSDQTYSFIGVPSPAAALVVASLPLCLYYPNVGIWLINNWLLYALILVLAFLMLTKRKFIAFKFAGFGFSQNLDKYLLVIVSIIALIVLWLMDMPWLAVPAIFLAYLLLSSISKDPPRKEKETLDVTV